MSIPLYPTRGFLLVHAASRVDLSRLEGSIEDVVSVVSHFEWSPVASLQLVSTKGVNRREPLFRSSLEFEADLDATAQLASILAAFQTIWFEVALTYSSKGLGQRYCYTPMLGMFHSQLDEAGNQVFNENQIRLALQSPTKSGMHSQLTKMLGTLWDAQLDQLRQAEVDGVARANLAS